MTSYDDFYEYWINTDQRKDLIQEKVQLINVRNKKKIFYLWLPTDFHVYQINNLFSKQNNIKRLK